jgi:BioD-like phosphotransacetylase family protein
MGIIQVVSDRPGAGKTCLISALLTRLAEAGKRAGYYKPFSSSPEYDPDVFFISQHLLPAENVPQPRPAPQGTSSGPTLTGQLSQEIQNAVANLNATADTILVEGPALVGADSQPSPLASQLASLLDARVLLVVQYARGLDATAVASASEPFSNRLAGVVINSTAKHRRREIGLGLVEELRSNGLPALGALPEDRAMLAVTVQQIAEHLGGQWVQEPVNTDARVDRFLIGANIMDSGPTYFGRFPNQAVIIRAERPDLQMACLMCDTKCLILTGGTQPIEYVKVEAMHREVPLILVDSDTLSTAEALEGLLERASPYSLQKVQRFAQLMRQHLDTAALEAILN